MARASQSGDCLCLILLGVTLAACSGDSSRQDALSPSAADLESALPARITTIDTSRFTASFRQRGAGPVFIKLTAEPGPLALSRLVAAGLGAPPGSDVPVTFDSLKIRAVYGYLPARSIRTLAQLPFVERIESADDIDRLSSASESSAPLTALTALSPPGAGWTWNLRKVRAPDLWSAFGAVGWRTTGPNSYQSVQVMVLDDGLDYRLNQFSGSPWEWWVSPDDRGNYTTDPTPVYLGVHGTEVAGFIAGDTLSSTWVTGVAPRSALMVSKVFPFTNADWGPVVAGLNQAATYGPSVINMSIANCGQLPPQMVHDAIVALTTRVPADAGNPGVGISMVAAAGNGTLNGCSGTLVAYPAAYSEVIAVSAIDSLNGFRAGYSRGPQVELTAPGIDVATVMVGGGLSPTLHSGSSYSAPHVAGLIAVIRALHNTWSADYVRTKLQQTAVKISGQTLPRDDRFGYGLINAYDVLYVAPPTQFAVTAGAPGSIQAKGTYPLTGSASDPAYGWTWERSDDGGLTWYAWASAQNSSFLASFGSYTINWRLTATRSSDGAVSTGHAATVVCTSGYTCDPL